MLTQADLDKNTAQLLKEMFPQLSDEEIAANIQAGKDFARDEACRERHKGLTMSNWDDNCNYPGGINYGGS